MVAVYMYSRTPQETTERLVRVFSSGGTAREQWSLQAEIMVEPVGWDALWKLSKEFCKKFDARFPCIACVTVTAVDFDSLTASVEVLSVQHEAVSLPEAVEEVPLIELWPTIKQREACVEAATTAEFIDLMRFFYTNIWMPWDDQDDKILLPNTIEERMQLWSELHNGTIPSYLARTIISLRNSAINANEKLKELASSLGDDDSEDDDESLLPPNYLAACAELTARLDRLAAQWTLYEKALIRDHYLASLSSQWLKTRSQRHVVALWQGGTPSEFEQISKFLTSRVNSAQTLSITPSAEHGLALEPEQLVVCSNEYELPEIPLANIAITSFHCATLKSSEMRSWLLMLSEECCIQSVRLHCRDVSAVLVMRAGELTARQCVFTDDSAASQSDFAQGIVAMADAKILLEDCTFENFYTGIVAHRGATLELKNCTIKKCGVGIQMYSGATVTLNNTSIAQCTEHSIRCELDTQSESNSMEGLHILPNCSIGSGDAQREVLLVRQDVDL